MNVLITIPSFSGKGGVSSYYSSILPFWASEKDYQISCLEIGGAKASYGFLHPLIDQIKFEKGISTKNVDLIHVNPSLDPKSFLRDSMFIYLAKRKRLPVLVFFHGWRVHFESLFESRLWYFFKQIYLKADAFIVLSSAFKEKLIKWGASVPIYIETTAVDEKLFSDFSIEHKVNMLRNSSKTRILFLARIEREKGIFETLDALNILIKRGHAVSLSIAGDGSAMREVTKILSTYQLYSKNVTLLGYVRGEKKKEVFNSHHIYCFPSYGEGMPISVLEAMAFGMPVVTRPVGGIKDFFENGKMGYVTEKKDPEMIANLIEQLLLDKEKMIDMGLYNHEYAKEHFFASKVAERLFKIYKKTYLENRI